MIIPQKTSHLKSHLRYAELIIKEHTNVDHSGIYYNRHRRNVLIEDLMLLTTILSQVINGEK